MRVRGAGAEDQWSRRYGGACFRDEGGEHEENDSQADAGIW